VVLGSPFYSAGHKLVNNIIVGHSVGIKKVSGTAALAYNDYYDNVIILDGLVGGPHERTDDPKFEDQAGMDYHLALDSPLIDKGDSSVAPLTDFEGDARPHGSAADIGADEAYRAETYVSILVGSDLTGDGSPGNPFETIKKALGETRTGGSIYVGRGEYHETADITRNVNLLGGYHESDWSRNISTNVTTLDADGTSAVVSIYGLGVQALVEGFTITGGEANVYGGSGGGIAIYDEAVATIRYNTITGNHALNGGGGLLVFGNVNYSSLIDSNLVYNNTADGEFSPCCVEGLKPPQFIQQGSEPGGGILASSARLVNNIVFDNDSGYGGDGIGAGGQCEVFHNTVVENGDSTGEGIAIVGTGEKVIIFNNLIVGHAVGIQAIPDTLAEWDYQGFDQNTQNYITGLVAGDHDVNGDARFIDPSAENYHVLPASIAAGTGLDLGLLLDFDGQPRPAPLGTSPDIGADEVEQYQLLLPLILR
jgi:hypothetical protein